MEIMLNGERRTLRDGLSVADLIAELQLARRRLAVEVNREVLARDDYVTRVLAAGDVVEIVHFIGGG